MRKVLIYTKVNGAELSNKDYSITNKLNLAPFETIEAKSEKEYYENVPESEIIISSLIDENVINNAKKLKWIQALTAGVNHMPTKIISEKNIILTSLKGAHKIQMTEYAIAMMVIVARQLKSIIINSENKQWIKVMPQTEIFGSTLGIMGVGEIGSELAKKAHMMGMNVLGVKRVLKDMPYIDKMYTFASIDDFYEQCDYIVNLLPATEQTHKIVDIKSFKRMKDTACFINIGRGSTVNEDDLAFALKTKEIAFLVSDVFYHEPLSKKSPLWDMDNVIITPHICGPSNKYMEKATPIILKNLKSYLNCPNEMINIYDNKIGY
ncbi:D-2-hydroxyacid dehydrogenase [Clostridium sediminicola]|uniref:D-2-hydroxyacid dehydrogenase n=1 Tax=Clostridium sediminicola TaxID=3114879 RepID=UPI0031F26EA3